MKKLILFLLFISTVCISQPSNSNAGGNKGGNGNGNNDPCKNPNNPNCNPVPISGIWILLLGGIAVGVYSHIKKRNNVQA